MSLLHWLNYYLGLTSGANRPYLFWSGFGSDLGEFTLVGAVVVALRHKNCHVKGCFRLGHADPSHGHPVCRTHQKKLKET